MTLLPWCFFRRDTRECAAKISGLMQCENLKALEIRGHPILFFEPLVAVGIGSRLKAIRYDGSADIRVIAYTLPSLVSLKHFELSGIDLGVDESDFSELLTHLPPTISSLSFAHLCGGLFEPLATCIAGGALPNLKELYLHINTLEVHACLTEAFRTPAGQKITTLFLSNSVGKYKEDRLSGILGLTWEDAENQTLPKLQTLGLDGSIAYDLLYKRLQEGRFPELVQICRPETLLDTNHHFYLTESHRRMMWEAADADGIEAWFKVLQSRPKIQAFDGAVSLYQNTSREKREEIARVKALLIGVSGLFNAHKTFSLQELDLINGPALNGGCCIALAEAIKSKNLSFVTTIRFRIDEALDPASFSRLGQAMDHALILSLRNLNMEYDDKRAHNVQNLSLWKAFFKAIPHDGLSQLDTIGFKSDYGSVLAVFLALADAEVHEPLQNVRVLRLPWHELRKDELEAIDMAFSTGAFSCLESLNVHTGEY